MLATEHPGKHPAIICRVIILDNQCARIFRELRIKDASTDATFSAWLDSLFLENTRAHIGQFAAFIITHHINTIELLDNSRIGHLHSENIGPIFVKIGYSQPRQPQPENVRPAARQQLYDTEQLLPVRSGDNYPNNTR